ncbi:hypothetical protein BJY00DRAFT_77982 [Aspergillus carlsbadensis]|nr:hypothetical protein BJY00DRAFT_77982 [Aspergillus carlsbadensis]
MRLPRDLMLMVKTSSGTLSIDRNSFHERYIADPWSVFDALYKTQAYLQSQVSNREKRKGDGLWDNLEEVPEAKSIRQTPASGSKHGRKLEADAMPTVAPKIETPFAPEPPVFRNMGSSEFGNWASLLQGKLETEASRVNTPEGRLAYLVEHVSGPPQALIAARIRSSLQPPINDINDALEYLAYFYGPPHIMGHIDFYKSRMDTSHITQGSQTQSTSLAADSGTHRDSIGFGNMVCDMRRPERIQQGLQRWEFNHSR